MDDGAARFRAAAQALNDNPSRVQKRELYREFRRVGKPIGERVIRDGSAELPRRGGLAARVAAAKMSQTNSTTGRMVGVALRFRTAPNAKGQSYDLQAMDDGLIRHPVRGNRHVWAVTKIDPGSFRKPFEAERDEGARAVVAAMESVAADIARRSR